MRKCSKCNQFFLSEEFPTYESASRGKRFRSNCRGCEIQRNRDFASTHREQKRRSSALSRKKKLAMGGDDALRVFLNSRLGGYKKTAGEKNLSFSLNTDYLISLFHAQNGLCYYTGDVMIYNHGLGRQQYNSMSLDRLNPLEGYIPGNVVFCTWIANNTKNMHPESDFYSFCEKILLYRNQRNFDLSSLYKLSNSS